MSNEEEEVTKPTVSGTYDALIGGEGHTAADRQQAAVTEAGFKEARQVARENREFVCRATEHVATQGIRQFIDAGAGLAATTPSVHECARRAQPDASVVYADNDAVVAVTTMGALYHETGVASIIADLAEPDALLTHPELTPLIDTSQPAGLIITSVLHFLPVETAETLMARFRDLLAPGSWLILSVGTGTQEAIDAFNARYEAGSLYLHTAEDLRGYLGGWQMADPGLVEARSWRSGEEFAPRTTTILAAVARKP